jgi:hypothetical protein
LTIPETLLVFVGIPAAVVAIIYLLVYAGSAANNKRYRPGRPYNQAAVWYVANKSAEATVAGSSAHEIGAGSGAHALAAGTAANDSSGEAATDDGTGLTTVGYGETGGASDSW